MHCILYVCLQCITHSVCVCVCVQEREKLLQQLKVLEREDRILKQKALSTTPVGDISVVHLEFCIYKGGETIIEEFQGGRSYTLVYCRSLSIVAKFTFPFSVFSRKFFNA